jgi:predicted HAD superfamily phosphohydrolase
VTSATFDDYYINELENASIEITKNGNSISPVKPILKEIASKLNLPIVNFNGNNYNTRQLGSLVIKSIN